MVAKHRSLFLVTLVLALGLFATFILTQEGLFFDGLTFAAIARNLSLGKGSWWVLSYTNSVKPQFFEHPPLYFWLESFFFSALGDHTWTEKIFGLTLLSLTLTFTYQFLIRLFQSESKAKLLTTIALIPWLFLHLTRLSFGNNLLESLVLLWAILSLFFQLQAFQASTVKTQFFNFFISAFLLFLSFLTKGPVGLFPLIFPFFYFTLLVSNQRLALGWTTLGFLFVGLSLGVLVLLSDAARYALTTFIDSQLLGSLNGARNEMSRIEIAKTLLIELTKAMKYHLLLVGLIGSLCRFKIKLEKANLKITILLFLIAISASLPFLLGTKFRYFYLAPSTLFYALALSHLALSLFSPNFSEKNYLPKIQLTFSLGMALATILLLIKGPRPRQEDASYLELVHSEFFKIHQGENLLLCPELRGDWPLHAYLQRYYRIGLEAPSTIATKNSIVPLVLCNESDKLGKGGLIKASFSHYKVRELRL